MRCLIPSVDSPPYAWLRDGPLRFRKPKRLVPMTDRDSVSEESFSVVAARVSLTDRLQNGQLPDPLSNHSSIQLV
jgi:hypothetical protein